MPTKPLAQGHVIGLLAIPIDPMFFRDGRPFGAASRGESGLPTPQTAYGMIKTFLMRRLGLDPRTIHGLRGSDNDKAWFSRVVVRGPWLAAIREERLEAPMLTDVFVPMPAHVVVDGDKRSAGAPKLLAPVREDLRALGWSTPPIPGRNAPLHVLWPLGAATGSFRPATGWLGREGLQEVLNGKPPSGDKVFCDDDLFQHEDRIGIGVGPNGTASDSMIYSVRLKRFATPDPCRKRARLDPSCAIGFYIEVGVETPNDFELLKSNLADVGALPFGGEGRRVRIHRLDQPWQWPKTAPATAVAGDAGGFATILISPALWGDGALQNRGEDAVRGRFTPTEMAGDLVALAMGKPAAVSGWDRAGRQSAEDHRNQTDVPPESPRPTRYAIPAGSVIFWQRGRTPAGESTPDVEAISPPPSSSDERGRTPAGKSTLDGQWQLAQTPAEAAIGWGLALSANWSWWSNTPAGPPGAA